MTTTPEATEEIHMRRNFIESWPFLTLIACGVVMLVSLRWCGLIG